MVENNSACSFLECESYGRFWVKQWTLAGEHPWTRLLCTKHRDLVAGECEDRGLRYKEQKVL